MLFTDLTGLLGNALALVTLAVRLPWVARFTPLQLAKLAGGVFVVSMIPVYGLSLAGFVRGIAGDLSVPTLLMLAAALVRSLSGRVLVSELHRRELAAFVCIAAVLLYPCALGLSPFDPYRLGFAHLWFIAGLSVLALAAFFRGYVFVASCIALAVVAWSVGWYESGNLWDHLLDPWLAIYAFAVQGRYWLARLREKSHA
ncbi:MAG TPA: hypothetical protein VK149_05815 [Sideroxyarcus sp.]|nr:hypothetical protein [Sideroxyarcus sp.]